MNIHDMPREEWVDQLYDRIHRLLDQGEVRKAQVILQALMPADQAEIFSDLPDGEQRQVLQDLAAEDIADILEKLENEEVTAIAEWLPPEKLADVLDEMEPDEAADLLGDLSPAQAADLLERMEEDQDVRPLLLHPDETAGGLMTSEFLALREHMTAASALEAIRTWETEYEYLYYYVVDDKGELKGVVSLVRLLKAGRFQLVGALMRADVIVAPIEADQETCAHLMSHYDLTSLPVVDANRRLMGVITIDDVIDVLEDEATEDIQRLGGAAPLEGPYLITHPLRIFQKRIGWLLLLFVTEMFTGTVLRHFEGELAKVVALSFFIPLLVGTGGNAGSQTTSTIIRAVAVGDVEIKDVLRAFRHEVIVGFLLGMGMGMVAFIRAITWGCSTMLATTVAASIWAIVLWANCIGSLLPLLAVKMKIDPAIVSGPLMSTLVDATGLFLYLTIARWLLRL